MCVSVLLLEERFGSTGLVSHAGLVSGYWGIWSMCLLLLGFTKHDGTVLFELADSRKTLLNRLDVLQPSCFRRQYCVCTAAKGR